MILRWQARLQTALDLRWLEPLRVFEARSHWRHGRHRGKVRSLLGIGAERDAVRAHGLGTHTTCQRIMLGNHNSTPLIEVRLRWAGILRVLVGRQLVVLCRRRVGGVPGLRIWRGLGGRVRRVLNWWIGRGLGVLQLRRMLRLLLDPSPLMRKIADDRRRRRILCAWR